MGPMPLEGTGNACGGVARQSNEGKTDLAPLSRPSEFCERLMNGGMKWAMLDMRSISLMETKRFAKRINELVCEYLDAPV